MTDDERPTCARTVDGRDHDPEPMRLESSDPVNDDIIEVYRCSCGRTEEWSRPAP